MSSLGWTRVLGPSLAQHGYTQAMVLAFRTFLHASPATVQSQGPQSERLQSGLDVHASSRAGSQIVAACRLGLQPGAQMGGGDPHLWVVGIQGLRIQSGCATHLARSSRKPLGASRATATMAQFQKKGAVAKRADTVGTRRHSAVDATSGRWYLYRQGIRRVASPTLAPDARLHTQSSIITLWSPHQLPARAALPNRQGL